MILEEYEHAKARGAKIYAEMVGEGMTSDAYHMTAPDPDGKGAERVMRLAIRDAGLDPQDIDYINTHGTSTPLGDVTELMAIKRVFGDHVYDMNLDSTKSMTGHLIGATGAVEAIACIMALKDGIIPMQLLSWHKQKTTRLLILRTSSNVLSKRPQRLTFAS